jgi:hypothetical protein
MSWITNFVGKINPQKTFDTISKGIDNLAFTSEERAKLNILLADKVADFAEKSLNENTIRSKSRRAVAYVVVVAYIGLIIFSLFVDSEYVHGLVTNSALNTAFLMVLAFFFGGYYMEGFTKKKK